MALRLARRNAKTGALAVSLRLTVNKASEGLLLVDYVARELPRLHKKRSQIAALIMDKEVLVAPDGVHLEPNTRVWEGLSFEMLKSYSGDGTVEPDPLRVLHSDDAVLVVDKPAGMVTHPSRSYYVSTVYYALARHHRLPNGFAPTAAHRLDSETSGVLVCGLSTESGCGLASAFASGQVAKEYLALCEGNRPTSATSTRMTTTPTMKTLVVGDTFDIELPLRLEATSDLVPKMRALSAGSSAAEAKTAKSALTQCKVERIFQDKQGRPLTLVRCMPKTGRQHQIRAHLAAIGMPLVGDKLYGFDETILTRQQVGPMIPGQFNSALSSEEQSRLRMWRHALHAAKVSFFHPTSNVAIQVEASLPSDITSLIQGLRPFHI